MFYLFGFRILSPFGGLPCLSELPVIFNLDPVVAAQRIFFVILESFRIFAVDSAPLALHLGFLLL